jgi:TnpA family transposase
MPQNARRDAGDHDPRATAPAASIRRSSLKAGIVAPSVMLRKLAAYRRQNQLDLALQELGRIERTLFMLDWLESPELRRPR